MLRRLHLHDSIASVKNSGLLLYKVFDTAVIAVLRDGYKETATALLESCQRGVGKIDNADVIPRVV